MRKAQFDPLRAEYFTVANEDHVSIRAAPFAVSSLQTIGISVPSAKTLNQPIASWLGRVPWLSSDFELNPFKGVGQSKHAALKDNENLIPKMDFPPIMHPLQCKQNQQSGIGNQWLQRFKDMIGKNKTIRMANRILSP